MKKRKIYIILSICIVAVIFAVGYTMKKNNAQKDTNISTKNIDKSVENKDKSTISSSETAKSSDKSAKSSDKSAKNSNKSKPGVVDINKVKALTQKLANEKQVLGSQIYENNNVHYAVITLKDDADSKNAKELATKYADLIEEAYNNSNINVKIVQNGKDVANVVLE